MGPSQVCSLALYRLESGAWLVSSACCGRKPCCSACVAVMLCPWSHSLSGLHCSYVTLIRTAFFSLSLALSFALCALSVAERALSLSHSIARALSLCLSRSHHPAVLILLCNFHLAQRTRDKSPLLSLSLSCPDSTHTKSLLTPQLPLALKTLLKKYYFYFSPSGLGIIIFFLQKGML